MRCITALSLCFPLLANTEGLPKTKRIDHTDVLHGVTIADPYRWLEDSSAADVKEWIRRQQAYTNQWLEGISERPKLRNMVQRLHDVETLTKAVARGQKVFFRKLSPGQNQSVLYVKDGSDATARVLIDPNKLSVKGTTALTTWEPSPDGKLLAYGLADSGSDWERIRVMDVASGKDLADQLDWIKFSGAEWAPDSKSFYYGRFPKPASDALTAVNEHQKLYLHRVGEKQDSDVLVFERPDQKTWMFFPEVTPGGRFLAVHVAKGTNEENLLFVKDLAKTDADWKTIVDEFYAAFIVIGARDDSLVVKTTYNAPKGRIITIALSESNRDAWPVLIPEKEDTLTEAAMDGKYLVLNYLRAATGYVETVPVDAPSKPQRLSLPANAAVALSGESRNYFQVTSFTAPSMAYECNDSGSCMPFVERDLPFDPEKFDAEQVFYPSKDGTRIPMFIVGPKGAPRDGNTPLLLYAYGGFNVSITPAYAPKFVAFMQLGGRVAVANLRGGGEFGEEWHKAGMLHNKQNVFDDFIAAAEYLIKEKYTSTPKLAVTGGSNGGLLIGAVVNQRPDLFGAAIPAVGVMDMLRYHKFTIGHAWADEYGSPDNPEHFRNVYKYSPLHNIRERAKYPATMVTTADHDDRVVPAHSFKYAAALQAAQGGEAPVLIRIQSSAGHGAGKPVSIKVEEDADVLAFLVRVLGMKVP
jgi:prolyl oligopeptidase